LYLVKLVFDEISFQLSSSVPDFSRILVLIAVELLLSVFLLLVDRLSFVFLKVLGDRFQVAVTNMILDQTTRLDLSFFETPEFYDSLNRAQEETSFRPGQILFSLVSLLQSSISILSLLFVLLQLDAWIVGALLIGAIVGLTVQSRFAALEFLVLNLQVPAVRKLHYYFWLLTNSYASKELKLYGLGGYLKEQHIRLLESHNTERQSVVKQMGVSGWMTGSLSNLIYSLVFASIAYSTLMRQYSLGDLTLYAGVFQQSQTQLANAIANIVGMYQAGLFIANLEKFLNFKPASSLKDQVIVKPTELQQGIDVSNVTFAYPGQNQPVINDVSFTVRPGEVIAIVGENGAGKTTLVKLICGLYGPISGAITLDGIPLSDHDVESLRRRYSAVFQDFIHFQGTVTENIALGGIEHLHDQERIGAVAQLTGAQTFIDKLPAKYDTVLGTMFEGGRELSGGQWQLIALSRALLRKSDIIILDEPTASLSPATEAAIFDTLRSSLGSKQIGIIISHRFSTVRLADRIIVLEHGSITETGSHQELMAKGGTYARLYNLQAASYQDNSQDQAQ
jgi:ABC-type multidrug transport system fused ATPase/permease subunit